MGLLKMPTKVYSENRIGFPDKKASMELSFTCELCGKAFAIKGKRNEHLKSHLNEKHHKCPKCGKRFRQQHGLRYHLKGHDGIRDFKCSKCDCGFTYSSKLKLHYLRKHADPSERRFEWIFCPKSFVNGAEMDRHLIFHIGEKPFRCDVCDNSYSDNSARKRHVRRVHSLWIPALF